MNRENRIASDVWTLLQEKGYPRTKVKITVIGACFGRPFEDEEEKLIFADFLSLCNERPEVFTAFIDGAIQASNQEE